MTYPIPNYSRIWVRGKFVDLGKAAREEEFFGVGQPVIFTPTPKVLLDAGTGQILTTSPFRVETSKTDGYFAIQLPATDDPDVIPVDFTYKVTEPSGRAAYELKVPINTPFLDEPGSPLHGQRVLDLVSVVPAPSPSSGTVQLLSGRGVWSVTVDPGDNHLRGMYTDGALFDAGPVSVGSVNGKTGTVVLSKADVGLGNVANTSDAAKPVSTAQASAIADARSAAQTAAQGYVDTHTAATDPHNQYLNQARADSRYRKITDAVTAPGVNGLGSVRLVGSTTSASPSGTWSVGDMSYNTSTRKWQYYTGSTNGWQAIA